MFNNEWRAFVQFNPGSISNSIYLCRDRGDYRTREYLTGENTIVTVKEGERLEDSKIRFAELDDDQLQALLVAFDKHGVKPPAASYTEGKLEATEKHLEDMRSIVGHVKKIPLKKEN